MGREISLRCLGHAVQGLSGHAKCLSDLLEAQTSLSQFGDLLPSLAIQRPTTSLATHRQPLWQPNLKKP
jgi:hypothetical protein